MPLWPDVSDDTRLSDHQKAKLKLATAGPVGILNGSPGTGKTFSAAAVVRKVIEQFGRDSIALAAPTGKAAVRLTQSMAAAGISGMRALTIHSLLGIGRNGHDGDGWGFIHDATNPLPYRFLLLDEGSMIDTDLMASFLDACADGTHVLILGDTAQLPPVGHGAPLRDMISAGVPCGELSEVRRNAGMIVHACKAIKDGGHFATAARVDLAVGDNLLFFDANTEAESADRLVGLLERATKFHPVTETQVIVGLNKKGPLSREAINARLHGLLNPAGRSEPGCPFKVGDKIICLRNSRMKLVVLVDNRPGDDARSYIDDRDRDGDPREAYIANGEIGYVIAITTNQFVATMGEKDTAVTIRVPFGKQGKAAAGDDDGAATEADGTGGTGGDDAEQGKGCSFDLAYAITVHKSQGSESPCIIAVVDPKAAMIADRNFWYTAISRAAKLCVIIGSRGVLDKQRSKLSLVKRKTFLKELIAVNAPG
jgi:exodeoxyribonuclease V alpha subunit